MRKLTCILIAMIIAFGFLLVPTVLTKASGEEGILIIKYNDLDRSGTDEGEPRLHGWMFLVEGPGAGGYGKDSIEVTTDSNGEFLLEPDPTEKQVWPWNYVITEILRPGCINTDPGDGTLSKDVTLTPAYPYGTVKFGNYCTGNHDGDGGDDTVGGTVGYIDKFGVLAPWLGLGLIVIGGLSWLVTRRLRIHT